MRREFLALFLFGIVFSLLSVGFPVNAQLSIGMRGPEVKMIQEILKSDPEIYPEGYVTGYFGSLTQQAIKRLQKRCGLPETGVIDRDTIRCLLSLKWEDTGEAKPSATGGSAPGRSPTDGSEEDKSKPGGGGGIALKVLSPNGGESWYRGETQTIKWERNLSSEMKVGIALLRKEGGGLVFVKHIAIVDPSDTAYSWKITPDVPNSRKYIIRICAAGSTITLCDESDGTFTITGEEKIEIKVSSPNGGERWDRNRTQTIKWEEKGEVTIVTSWKIDLYRKVSGEKVFVKEIAKVEFSKRTYSWEITPDVRNSNDYIIKICKEGTTICDESDGTFEIFEITEEETKPQTPDIKKIIQILEKVIEELKKAIELLGKI